MTAPDAWLSRTAVERELAAGAVVILATDTLPGLHARLDRPDALALLRKLKHRSEGKPFLVLAGSIAQARGLITTPTKRVSSYIQACWPGPFTLILKASEALPIVVVAA